MVFALILKIGIFHLLIMVYFLFYCNNCSIWLKDMIWGVPSKDLLWILEKSGEEENCVQDSRSVRIATKLYKRGEEEIIWCSNNRREVIVRAHCLHYSAAPLRLRQVHYWQQAILRIGQKHVCHNKVDPLSFFPMHQIYIACLWWGVYNCSCQKEASEGWCMCAVCKPDTTRRSTTSDV